MKKLSLIGIFVSIFLLDKFFEIFSEYCVGQIKLPSDYVKLKKQSTMESLILAQDERWRRA